jgi:2-amino-4-hydroxy-6-hydroxymethyldihydropteridine diphosphokinase
MQQILRGATVTHMPLRKLFLGIGANLDDPAATLADAVGALARIPGWHVDQISPLYRTTPVGLLDQPDFLNAALALSVELPNDPAAAALEVLVRCKELERLFGRVASVRNGPRRLDLDIIALDDLAVIQPRPPGIDLNASGEETAVVRPLVVPHPAAHERLFVLAPLADIAPGLHAPGWRGSAAQLRDARLTVEGEGAAIRIGAWDFAAARWV